MCAKVGRNRKFRYAEVLIQWKIFERISKIFHGIKVREKYLTLRDRRAVTESPYRIYYELLLFNLEIYKKLIRKKTKKKNFSKFFHDSGRGSCSMRPPNKHSS